MPVERGSTLSRSIVAVGAYLTLVVVASFAFSWMALGGGRGLAPRYSYALCGPALALFTHMSYGLFAAQSLLLLPWLLAGAADARLLKVLLVGFVACWLGIGWYMHNLF